MVGLLKYLNISDETRDRLRVKALQKEIGKRSVNVSPLRYAGGKSRAIGQLLMHLPTPFPRRIVSPFFGGGSFEIFVNQKLGVPIIGYDIFDLLVLYWNYQINAPEMLYNELTALRPDEETFTRVRAILMYYYKKHHPEWIYNNKDEIELTESEKNTLDDNPLKLAAYYYYNHQLSFGPMFLGWKSSVYLNEQSYRVILERVRSFSVKRITVSQKSFEEVIPIHNDDFLFIDPPYYDGNDSELFKPIYPNPNFPFHHKGFDHKLLRDLLSEHRGGFILTYNNCETIRRWYSDYEQFFPEWHYSFGQGETRIGKNRERIGNNIKKSHEIIIVGKRKT